MLSVRGAVQGRRSVPGHLRGDRLGCMLPGMKILGWLWCRLDLHEWTCRASEGLVPKPEDRPKQGDDAAVAVMKFKRFARMYCRRCGRIYGP